MRNASPDWVRAGITQLRDEITLFVGTLWGFLRHPRLFTRGFLCGEIRALNPFGYLFTALGVVGAAQACFLALAPKEVETGSLLRQLLAVALPPVYYVTLGLVTHGLLWLSGSRSSHVRDTAAVALFASGPAYIGYAILLPIAGLIRYQKLPEIFGLLVIAPLGIGSLLAFVIPFVAALREIHDVRRAPWLRPILAFGIVFVLSGFFFGLVEPPGSYGLHPKIGPGSSGHWNFFFGD